MIILFLFVYYVKYRLLKSFVITDYYNSIISGLSCKLHNSFGQEPITHTCLHPHQSTVQTGNQLAPNENWTSINYRCWKKSVVFIIMFCLLFSIGGFVWRWKAPRKQIGVGLAKCRCSVCSLKKPQGAISELRFNSVSKEILVHNLWRGNVFDSARKIYVHWRKTHFNMVVHQDSFWNKVRAARKWLIPTFGLLWQQLDSYIFYGLKTNRQAGKYPAEERHIHTYIHTYIHT